MSVTPAQWKQVYQRFDPRARVEATDGDLFVSRPGAAVDMIVQDLDLGIEPRSCWVVCGSYGTGKSSELMHLSARLWDQRAVVGLDVFQSAVQINQITAAEVLFLVGAAAVQSAAEIWGHPVPTAMVDRLTSAFYGLLRETVSRASMGDLIKGVALFTANLAAPGSAAVVGAATGAAQIASAALSGARAPRAVLGGLTRSLKEGEPDLDALVEAVNEILDSLSAIRPPVVLVDGLDKVSELLSIRALFSATRSLARLSVPVVYTAPITLMLTPEWQATGATFKRVRLTNVVTHRPVVERVLAHVTDDDVAQGRAALRQVIANRLRRESLSVEDAFTEKALLRVIEASGGLLRELIQLVNRAVRAALVRGVDRIGEEEAEAAITEIRKEYAITLTTERVRELVHVRQHGEPTGATAVSVELLIGGYVLPYANGDVWFEPHPILHNLRPGL